MSTAVAADFLTEITETKSPDVKLLLELRERLYADPVLKRQAENALERWTATRERQGVLLFLMGRVSRALNILESEAGTAWGRHFLARAYADSGFYAKAEELLTAEYKDTKALYTALPLFRALVGQGKLAEAEKLVKSIKDDSPAVRACRLELQYREGDLEGAVEGIVALHEAHPEDRVVGFVLALIAQAAGDDDAARRAYERISQNPPVAVDVLINLGTLYEDEGLWDLALKCYEAVLKDFPNHPRARLFKRDAEASKNMFYDEDRERKEDKRMQILRTPVTDFELSVRSRNCLQKMKIETLGDLILKTESELLSYKNFGETSLQEIKSILASKGLRLGMRQEEALAYAPPEDATAAAAAVAAGDDKLARGIETLELSVRSRRCMERLGIKTVGELVEQTEAELLAAPNFGQTSLNEVRQKLAELGLALKG
ncbi:MAG: tetratricopeptide repeat protein [Planctomycetes bacterium]|jgi:DNA-directed RNA polymerase subunit alpha|nr:tetratricopeptide repeat protein [Planctomycetota bacterium]MCL4731786.1 tetratricopeptide repeat protein [Planctomycetota bacterium]